MEVKLQRRQDRLAFWNLHRTVERLLLPPTRDLGAQRIWMTRFCSGFQPRKILLFHSAGICLHENHFTRMSSPTCKFCQKLEEASSGKGVFGTCYLNPTGSKGYRRCLAIWESTMTRRWVRASRPCTTHRQPNTSLPRFCHLKEGNKKAARVSRLGLSRETVLHRMPQM